MSTVIETSLSTITLECIDGKDDHFKMEIDNGEKLVLGKNGSNNGEEIKELEDEGGCIIFSNTNGLLQVDATDCTVPVKINGKAVKSGIVREVDVLIIGNSIWKTFLPEGAAGKAVEKKSFTKSISSLIGVEDLQDFKLSSIFSEVF